MDEMNLQLFAERIEEYALANIAMVEFVTEEDIPVTYALTDVATEAGVEAHLSEGIDEALRVKNTIKAQNKTKDIVLGYDVTLTQATMIPEILALVDGGVWDEATKKYTAPLIGTPVERTKFTLNIYTEQKDGDGSTKGYVKFVYKNCEGQPLSYSLVEGEFYAPEISAESRPKLGESPVEFDIVDTLPSV